MADEEKNLGSAADFGYGRYGGYADTHTRATGYFRVEQVDGKWWFVDPEGHLFLSTGINSTPGGGAGFGGGAGGRRGGGGRNGAATQTTQSAGVSLPGNPATARSGAAGNSTIVALTNRRLDSWGMTTGGMGRPATVMLNWPRTQSTYLGIVDVYSAEFAAGVDAAADRQCTPRKNDPLVLGYFVGNEPPWGTRESEVVDMILAGPDSATKTRLRNSSPNPAATRPLAARNS